MACCIWLCTRGSYLEIWILYRTMHSDYVLVLFAPLHSLVYLYLQTNHLFMYIQYSLKLSLYRTNSSYKTVFNSKLKVSFERKPHQIPPQGIQI